MTAPICSTYAPSSVAIAQQDSPIFQLLLDVWARVSKDLSVSDILSCQSTCKRLYTVLQNDGIWRDRFSSEFPGINKKFNNFQSAYKLLDSNLAKGAYTSFHLTDGRDGVYSLVVLGNKLFSCSWDDAINVWDLNSKECIATLRGHEDRVFSLAVLGDTLFSGSWDGTIKTWDVTSKECIATLRGHEDRVGALTVLGNTLFSGVSDGTIKIWDLHSKECIATLQGHEDLVSSLVVLGNALLSGSWDGTIKIWDLTSKECIATLENQKGEVSPFAVLGNTLFSGVSDGTIKIWDLNSKECVATLQGHRYGIVSLAVLGNTLFSGSLDRTIKIWDLNSNKCRASLLEYGAIAWSFTILDGKLALGTKEMITVLDFAADHSAVFSEIANQLRKGEDYAAVTRFLRMPQASRDAVYAEFYAIIERHFVNFHLSGARRAFHDLSSKQFPTLKERAQAIENYLKNS